jgi:hypothetical protein
LVVAGLCAGVATLFRYDIGIATFGAEGGVLAFHLWVTRVRELRAAIRMLILFGVGFAIPVVPVAVAFALLGVLPDLVYQVVILTGKTYLHTRAVPFPRPWMLRRHADAFAVYLPVVAIAISIPTMATLLRQRLRIVYDWPSAGPRPAFASRITLSALVALTLVYIAKASVRVSPVQMAMALVSSLALVGVVAQPLFRRGTVGRLMAGGTLAIIIAFMLWWIFIGLIQASRNVAWAMSPAAREFSPTGESSGSGSCRLPAGLERMACFRIDPAEVEAIRYVQQRTAPDDPVFVGLPRHDRIVINNVLLYFAMIRKSATQWYQYDPGITTSEQIQRIMIRDLEHAKPKLVIINDVWAEQEPNDSAVSSGVTLLDDYIRTMFGPAATFGEYIILQRRLPEQ